MEIVEGSIRFGLWFVYVRWDEQNMVSRVRFVNKEVSGHVPIQVSQFLAGRSTSLDPLHSIHMNDTGVYGEIYQQVAKIPYGELRTYKEIADTVGTGARVVGLAMKRNLTPLIIPCHRVVSSSGIGGFTPDILIKQDLIALEEKVMRRQAKGI